MPGAALHFTLCTRLVGEQSGQEAIDVNRDERWQAFLSGAVGPDVGYFPGGETRLADLAHHLQPAPLALTLLGFASTPLQEAFAYGWISHVMLDQVVHPLINRRVAELRGRPDDEVSYGDDPITHIRVETGLDAAFFPGNEPAFATLMDRNTMAEVNRLVFLSFQAVHGGVVSRSDVEKSIRASERARPWLKRYLALLSRTARGRAKPGRQPSLVRPREPVAGSLLPGLLPRVAALLRPITPDARLAEAVDRVLVRTADRFRELQAGGFADLPNLDLDTGLDAGLT